MPATGRTARETEARRNWLINTIVRQDKRVFLIDGHFIEGMSRTAREAQFGMLAVDLQRYGARGQITAIAQFYELVIPGLILTRHVFRGLERPLFCDGSMQGDGDKLVYTRKPAFDFEWTGGPEGHPTRREVPAGKVFAVIISPNKKHKDPFPEVAGWIHHWNWVDEDSGFAEAPIHWVDRYTEKLWTRGE